MAVIGIDIGGTKIAAAALSAEGEVLRRSEAELGGRVGAEVGGLAVELFAAVRNQVIAGGDVVTAVGAGVPGIYRAGSGTVWAPNIPGWDDYPLRDELQDAAGADVPVRVDSDRACYVLGEAWRGVACGCRHVVFVAVGTGIGAGILVDGRVLRGRSAIAGAIGWLALSRPWLEPYRDVGCFEHHASGSGIATVAQRLAAGTAEYSGPLRLPVELTARDVFAAHDAGDPIAARVIDDAVACWGMAAANLVSLFNPEKIVFGGGVFGPGAKLLPRIREEAVRWAQPIAMREVTLEPSALGSDAGLIGAGRLALDDVA
ncbi:MAG: ROK family protein [Longimicrobiales bacterium]